MGTVTAVLKVLERVLSGRVCVCAHYVVRYSRPDTPCCGSELAISSHHHPNRLRPVSLSVLAMLA